MSDVDSDDAKPASKKRKATRACDRCNSQHQPCDNALPKCSVCERAGTACTYDRPVRKRGPRSGYTGQNGERLWSIVLQARPDLEDLVLQIIRGGTFADTGISNLEYYKNNDNQGDLVNRFDESRLGKFLRHGESPDLHLPPIDPNALTAPLGGPSHLQSALPDHPGRGRLGANAMPSHSQAFVDALGGPQNPGDIYVQSEDIRRQVSYPRRGHDFGIAAGPRGQFDHYVSPPTHATDDNGYADSLRHLHSNGTQRDSPRESQAKRTHSISDPSSQAYPASVSSIGQGSSIDVTSSAHWWVQFLLSSAERSQDNIASNPCVFLGSNRSRLTHSSISVSSQAKAWPVTSWIFVKTQTHSMLLHRTCPNKAMLRMKRRSGGVW